MIDWRYGAITQIKAAQGNAEDHAADLPRRIPQTPQPHHATRSATRFKIALNCWFPSCLRLYRKVNSSRYVCR